MAWVKFETCTSDKPEVWQIAQSLGIDPDAVVGKLLRVWAWFDEQTEDGNAPSVTKALLDRNVGVTGFVTSMLQVGWMVEKDGQLSIPNFGRHNGDTAKKRALTAKRVSESRGNSKDVTQVKQNCNATSVTGALPREEKIREREEEKKDNTNPPLSPNGGKTTEEEKPKAKRKPSETVGEFQPPKRLDTPEVRQALADFESMRLRTGKRIKDRSNVCRGWDTRFVDAKHLLACIDVAISNEYQGISPDYIDPSKVLEAKKPSLWDTAKKY